MVKKLQEDIYLINVPLPKSPLKQVNAYVVLGERPLLIDAGFDLDICEVTVRTALAELEVDPSKLDILLTHWHNDHAGLLARLVTPSTKVFSGDFNYCDDVNVLSTFLSSKETFRLLDIDLADLYGKPEFDIAWRDKVNCDVLQEGDELVVGKFRFRVILTPGHFINHICLYEPDKKILFAGDHILDSISPNIASYEFYTDELKVYLENLAKIKALEVEVVYPGHRNVIIDHKRRISEIEEHHRVRLEEIEGIIKGVPKTAIEVAAGTTWHISNKNWYSFAITQKVFSLGETLAHINYLLNKGVVKISIINGRYCFSIK